MVEGRAQYIETTTKVLDTGSYFGSKGKAIHDLKSSIKEESIIYIRTNGKFKVIPVKN